LLKDYRDWLTDEITLLEDGSDRQYELGRANMASRALARFDAEIARTLYVALDRALARRVLTTLEAMGQQSTATAPELAELRDAITAAMDELNESPAH